MCVTYYVKSIYKLNVTSDGTNYVSCKKNSTTFISYFKKRYFNVFVE